MTSCKASEAAFVRRRMLWSEGGGRHLNTEEHDLRGEV